LVLSGDRDQFARVDLLRQAVHRLRGAELHVYPGLRHGLLAVAEDVAERIAVFVSALSLPRPAATRVAKSHPR
jgi:hypothetical protein